MGKSFAGSLQLDRETVRTRAEATLTASLIEAGNIAG